MGMTAKALVPRSLAPRSMHHPTTRVKTAICLDESLAVTVKLQQILELSPFVVVLIPESSIQGEADQHKIGGRKPLNEHAEPAKITDILSKAAEQLKTPSSNGEFLFGQVRMNFTEMSAFRNGEPVSLTVMEFKALKYLIQNARRVISRNEMLDRVWGYENYPCTRTVDNHILRLRQKLEENPSEPRHIQTVHGAGYKFLP